MTEKEAAKHLLTYSTTMGSGQTTDAQHNEAKRLAIKALESIPKYKDAYGKGWEDGAKATYEHLKLCEEEQEPQTDILDAIRAEIKQLPYQRIFGKVSSYSLLDAVIEIIDKYKQEG